MTYQALKAFVQHDMRMSHIYQPVMIAHLLRHSGRAPARDIARAILNYDESQLDYYTQITHNMVGRVLRGHEIIERSGQDYSLLGFSDLNASQVSELISLCEERLDAYLALRGSQVFEHRRKSAGYISGTIRYEVLKRARFRCFLCGVSADERALEVDHIQPRNVGGPDDISNYQALCYRCNAMKRDRDSTDFRAIPSSYLARDADCPFCDPDRPLIFSNALALALLDAFPVVPGHCLVVPRRHCISYFDLGTAETNACQLLLHALREKLCGDDSTIEGFNIGVNDGGVAGQTVGHAHLHLIPRRRGDVPSPRGGVRGVIPGRQDYTSIPCS